MSGGFTENTERPEKTGFSLIEVMTTLVVLSVVIGTVTTYYGDISRITTGFLESVFFREQLSLFLMKFDEDYTMSEVNPTGEAVKLDQLRFEFDLNQDGDLRDSGEVITYRWDRKNKEIDRKSGKGYFQSFLPSVTGFSWSRLSSAPLCHQMKIRDTFSSRSRTVTFCHASGSE